MVEKFSKTTKLIHPILDKDKKANYFLKNINYEINHLVDNKTILIKIVNIV